MKSYATKLPIQIDFVAEITQPSSGGETRPAPPGSHRRARWLWQMTCTQWCSNSFTSSPERLLCDHIAPTHIRLHHQPPSREVFFPPHRCTEEGKKKEQQWKPGKLKTDRLVLLASLQQLMAKNTGAYNILALENNSTLNIHNAIVSRLFLCVDPGSVDFFTSIRNTFASLTVDREADQHLKRPLRASWSTRPGSKLPPLGGCGWWHWTRIADGLVKHRSHMQF